MPFEHKYSRNNISFLTIVMSSDHEYVHVIFRILYDKQICFIHVKINRKD